MKHLILFIALLVSNGLAIARTTMSDQLSKTTRMNTQSEIYFAGGCFWGTEHFMKQIDGVTNTRVGYANGKMSIKNPTYEHHFPHIGPHVADASLGHTLPDQRLLLLGHHDMKMDRAAAFLCHRSSRSRLR